MANNFYKLLIILCAVRIIYSKRINYETYCPGGYNHVPNTTICALITTNATIHRNVCLKLGQTDTNPYEQLLKGVDSDHLIEFLLLRGIRSVWLPIRKNLQKMLVWKLPLPLWNTRLDFINSTNAPKNYERGDCVLYLVDNSEPLLMENCDTIHHHLCIYSQGHMDVVITKLCYGLTDTMTPRLAKFHEFCFVIEMINFTTSEQTVFIGSDDKLVAVIQFIGFNDIHNEKVQVATNFFPNVPSGYVTAVENSAIVFVDKQYIEYRVAEKNIAKRIQNFNVAIHIRYDSTRNILIVNVRNYQFLWTVDYQERQPVQCYTDANLKTDILAEYYANQTDVGPNCHIEIELPKQLGIGNYWCEGQKFTTFETVESNRLTIIHKEESIETLILSVYAEQTGCRVCEFYSLVEKFSWIANTDFPEMSTYDHFKQDWPGHVELKKILSIRQSDFTILLHVHIQFPTKALDRADNLNYYAAKLRTELSDYNISKVLAIDTCFSQDLKYFSNAQLNEISVFKSFCLMDTGLPPMQKCIGNQIDGAYWEHVYNTTDILENCDTSLMNEQAEQFFYLNQQMRMLNDSNIQNVNSTEIIEQILSSVNQVITLKNDKVSEVQYAAITLNNLFENPKIDVFKAMKGGNVSRVLDPVIEIIDTLMDRETHPLVEDPNRILGTIDALAAKFAASELTNKLFLESEDGVILIHKSNIILMIVNPAIKNISGIALYKKTKAAIDLNDFSVRKLQGHEKAVHIYNKSLELSAQIPSHRLAKIHMDQNGKNIPPKRIIFKIYYRNSLFDETLVDPETDHVIEAIDTNSKIVSISVSNYTGVEDTHGLFVMFRTKLQLRRSIPLFSGCSDFSATADSSTKRWNRDFSKFEELDKNMVVCPVKRLSNIGFVKLFGNKIVTDKQTRIFITISHFVTIIGCILSVFGLVMIFCTAIFYEKWKRREATPLVLNVSVATFLQIIMFSVAESHIFVSSVNCIVVGGILHYFTLVALFISLFVADCQYRRYVLVFGPAKTHHFKIKIFLLGWLVPFIIVVGCMVLQPDSYIPSEEFKDLGGICYPTDIILKCFVHFPIITIFCINSGVYCWIIYQLTREDPSLRKTPRKSIIMAQIRLFFFIFMVLSLTWIFGLLAHYTELYAFSFLFNLFAPMQGFCLFIFCCLVDSQTRNFWIKCKLCKKKL